MKNKLSESITACRSCRAASLQSILDLGKQPPANSLRRICTEAIPVFPLHICRCEVCTTVQLTETVAPEFLFSEYVWVTGTSRGAREYSRTFCEGLRRRVGRERLFVVEVASNDGTFLRRFQEVGDRVLGIDPARNVAAQAVADGVPTITGFFGRNLGRRIRQDHGLADAVFARNVLPHVPDPCNVLAGMAECLDEHGILVVEFHQAGAILDELHYDSIYHEHLYYHSLHSMEYLLGSVGLVPFDLTTSPISGGSLVLYCSRQKREPSAALNAWRDQEKKAGAYTAERWQRFAAAVWGHRDRLQSIVAEEQRLGHTMIGYGASARSSTLLNFCGIDHRHLACIADRNSIKHGTWTAGTDIAVVSPDDALRREPDTVLLLAWNFKDEILAELKERGFHGRVVLPLPGDPVVLDIG